MEVSIRKDRAVRVLNTQGCCFFCLKSEFTKDGNKTPEVNLDANVEEQVKINSLRCVNRYLKNNVDEPGSALSIKIPAENGTEVNTELKVYLCETCEQLNSRFSYLFQQFEKIKMEMDFYLEKVQTRIFESSKDCELVQNYSKKMTSDRETLTQLAFVDKLRKEIAAKSSRSNDTPRVYLTRTNVRKIETIKTEVTYTDIEDFPQDPLSLIITNPPEELPSTLQLEQEMKLEFEETLASEEIQDLNEQKNETSVNGINRKYYFRNASTGKYHCTSCHKPFFSSCYVRLHYQAVHLKRKLTCDICLANFSFPKSLRRHKKTCKGLKNIKTKLKGFYYTKNTATGMFHCVKCNKEYVESGKVKLHYEVVHLKKRYKCDICNISVLTTENNLNVHKKTCRQTLAKRLEKEKAERNFEFSCNLCGHKTATRKKLSQHKWKVHNNVDKIPCDFCHKKFRTSDHLRDHRDAVHLGKRFSCGFCNKDCSYKYMMRMHERKCEKKPIVKIESHIRE